MVERQPCCRAWIDMGTFFMSVVKPVAEEAERWSGVHVGVSEAMAALQAGVTGRCDTAWGLTGKFRVSKGLGQGCVNAPSRAKLVLRLMQGAVSRIVKGFKFRAAPKRIPQVFFADDGSYLCDSLHGIQLALDTSWLIARAAGLQVKVKKDGKKTAWAATYWRDGREYDVAGWDIKLPDGTVVPQVKQYKHLGNIETSTWAGSSKATREKVVTRCTQL